jgi:hypothetical protein
LVARGSGFGIDPRNESKILKDKAADFRGVMSDTLMATFNAPLLLLRVLHKFDVLPKLEQLRRDSSLAENLSRSAIMIAS